MPSSARNRTTSDKQLYVATPTSPHLTLRHPVRLVAVGGLDPRGGAGLVRDYETAMAWGAAPVLVGTAWTDQSRQGVRAVEPRLADAVARALEVALGGALAEAGTVATAVKVGMTATPEIVDAIVDALGGFEGPVVFDPVLAATSGGALFAGAASRLLPLVHRATLSTPNLAEAAALAASAVSTLDEAGTAGRTLIASGARAVLVKGGHLAGDATDLLVGDGTEELFPARRIPGPSPRGTGCALASAIAIALADGRDLREAVVVAKGWLHDRILHARLVGDERHL
jgi:hydroxymethylpyrimidine/phosphomethylpyrimidine kinase